jgi:HEAT repeat protein
MATIQELCVQLGSGDLAQSFAAHQQLLELVTEVGAPDRQSDRSVTAAALASELASKNAQGHPRHAPEVRRKTARMLALVAGDAEIPALQECLGDFLIREDARWALDRMLGEAATAALAQALEGAVGTEFRVGLINALGRRHDPQLVSALRQAAEDKDQAVRWAALEALANYPDASTDELLAKVAKRGKGAPAQRAARIRLRLAASLAADGQTDQARQIYQAVSKSSADQTQREAAERGLKQLG